MITAINTSADRISKYMPILQNIWFIFTGENTFLKPRKFWFTLKSLSDISPVERVRVPFWCMWISHHWKLISVQHPISVDIAQLPYLRTQTSASQAWSDKIFLKHTLLTIFTSSVSPLVIKVMLDFTTDRKRLPPAFSCYISSTKSSQL